jgi:hypothetical protein
MTDAIMQAFLRRQHEDGLTIASKSDLVGIEPLNPAADGQPDRFLVRFACRGLVRETDGSIVEANDFRVGIWFAEDYLRNADPFHVLTWLGPRHVWHPNISSQAPVICVGRLAPGTDLVDLVYQCWEIITWNKVTMREDDSLNKEACQWARANLARLPVDTRPLKRRALAIQTADISPEAGHASV